MWTVESENRTARRAVVVVALFGLLASACGGGPSDKVQYKDPDDLALFEVPNDWNVYDADDLSELGSPTLLPFAIDLVSAMPINTLVAFDAGPARNVSNLSQRVTSVRYPLGTYLVRDVSRDERDVLSRATLESLVLWPQFYTILPGGAEIDFDFGSDYEGIYRIVGFEDAVTEERGVVVFTSVTNPDDTLIYSIAVGCAEDCFAQYADEMYEVVDSWVVNTKK